MINKIIIDGENVELTDKSQVPYTHTFAQADTHIVRFGLDSGDEICAYAFKDCTELSYISFPEQITKIKREAFKGCTSLERLTIGENINYIGKGAFDDCTSLEEVEFKANEPSPSIFCKFPTNTMIYVPDDQKYEEIPYSEMNLDGTVQYFTQNAYSYQFEKIYDVTFCDEQGTYFRNKWESLGDDNHITENKNRYPVTSIYFDEPVSVNVGERFELSYVLTPENATNTTLHWYTSLPNLFTIITDTPNPNTIWIQPTENTAYAGSQASLTAYSESGVVFTGRLLLN